VRDVVLRELALRELALRELALRELVLRELVRDAVADRFDAAVRFVRLGTGLRDVTGDLLWSI
jgi:hypothetical protein